MPGYLSFYAACAVLPPLRSDHHYVTPADCALCALADSLDPNWQDAAARLQGRARGTGSAPTATAAIFSQG